VQPTVTPSVQPTATPTPATPITPSAQPTATPTAIPAVDYSSYFDTNFVNAHATVIQPFTKSTNERGDSVYAGITHNPSVSYTMTTVIELTKSQAEAKQLYDPTVAQALNQGFVLRSDWAAQMKANYPGVSEVWDGQQSSTGLEFSVQYYYDAHVASWLVVTEAQG